MQTPLIATKLYQPSPALAAIRRPRLLAKLDRSLPGKLTLFTAPAGFGKSTLMSQWARTTSRPVAWLTLDTQDNDPPRFLAYVIAALQGLDAALGEQTLALLRSPQPPPLETLLTTLINELARMPQPALLVLDDYHLIEAPGVQQIVNFLLTYLPSSLHLVIGGRAEPPLALARLRVAGELVEIQTADLRFSRAEVAEFFAQALGVSLPAAVVSTLEARTEGWAAALRLAAALLPTDDAAKPDEQWAHWLATVRGDDRHLFAYLTEEVFDRLTPAQQTFLVQTAPLQRLCGPLCAAVTGQPDSQALLAELARANLFLLPLDNQRHWYRYHPLFEDFLRHRLQQLTPEQIATLHGRAAAWYAAQGLAEAAIDHALAAQHLAWAAELLEAQVLRLVLSNETATLARWLQLLPLALRQSRPLLAFAEAGLALLGAQFIQAKHWVETAERALAALPAPASLPVAPLTIQGYLDALRCTAMVNLHDPVTAIIAVARRALVNLPADEAFLRGAVALNLGDAYGRQQAVTLAADALAEAVALTQAASNLTVHLAALGSQGELYARQGYLTQAAAIYQHAIVVGQTWGKATGESHPATGKAHAFYAHLLYAWNQLAAAEEQATAALACCKRWGHTHHLVDSYLALVHCYYAQGRVEEANAAFMAMRLVTTESWNSAHTQSTPATAAAELMARVDHTQLWLWLRTGRLADAERWLAEHAADDHLAVWFVRLRLALAQDQPAAAAEWLDKTQQQLTGRIYLVGQIQWQLLAAQWRQRQGHPDEALAALRLALTLAEPGGYIRPFLDEGPAVAGLLHRLVQQTGATEYIDRVLTAFGLTESRRPVAASISRSPTALIEPLSERERAVLRLIAADLTYEAIGEKLIISLNTVRTHTKNIYSKLNVNRRSQAIARAQELGLL